MIFINRIISNYFKDKDYDKIKEFRNQYNLSIKDVEIILKLNKLIEKITLTSKIKKLIT